MYSYTYVVVIRKMFSKIASLRTYISIAGILTVLSDVFNSSVFRYTE